MSMIQKKPKGNENKCLRKLFSSTVFPLINDTSVYLI